jgi:hypothetical protein
MNDQNTQVKNTWASTVADPNGWSVKVDGVTMKYFSKYEDYALTEARDYARKLNSENSKD